MTDSPLILMATLVFAGTMLFGIGITLTAGREVSRGRTAPMRRLSVLGYGLMGRAVARADRAPAARGTADPHRARKASLRRSFTGTGICSW